MRQVWPLLMALAMLPTCSFAQEPSDCVAYRVEYDDSGAVTRECVPYSKFPPSTLKRDRLRKIGDLGPAGRMRTPYVLELLKDEDWGVRAEAAQTLGRTGETSAIPYLVDAIGARDWKLTFEAMTSLWNLQAPQAIPVVKEIAGAYWKPGIRAAAQRLLDGFPEQRTYWLSMEDAYCRSVNGKKNASIPGARLASHPDLFGASEIGKTVAVEGGILVAVDRVDRGEWGRGLEFRPDLDLLQQLLLTQEPIEDETVMAVVKSPQGIFALTGSGHMGLDDGFIYKVDQIPDGKWKAQVIWRLPGAPYRAIASPDGTLGIQTNNGDVIFRPNSGMEWISCPLWK
ncbi:HEAT repeat domain-containing protein [Taklimakanibacter lacteus]|uniref:HEAT repeat domain-containing protein n=1 Tax=Taklimakanibacter lacteus TaxID=2268456 RepID=UPI0013C4AD50